MFGVQKGDGLSESWVGEVEVQREFLKDGMGNQIQEHRSVHEPEYTSFQISISVSSDLNSKACRKQKLVTGIKKSHTGRT